MGQIARHYFVPLGRERGGYLEFLGLPPDATEAENDDRDIAFRLEVENAFRASRKGARKQRDEGEITAEQADALIAEFEEAMTSKLEKLNELKEKIDKKRAEERERARGGHRQDEVGWVNLYAAFDRDTDGFRDHFDQPRPIPRIDATHLRRIKKSWITTESAAPRRANDEPVDLATFSTLLVERDLVTLLAADSLWSRVGMTNRDRWRRRLEQWADEISDLGPTLSPPMKGDSPAGRVEFPSVGKPANLAIEGLEEGEVGAIASLPDRSARPLEIEPPSEPPKRGKHSGETKKQDKRRKRKRSGR